MSSRRSRRPSSKARSKRTRPGPTETVEGVVRALAHGGDGVVDTDEGVVFVAGAWVGETIRFGRGHRRRGVARGRLLAVLEPSAHRRDVPCAVADACGGCAWMMVDEAAQRDAKRAHLQEVLARGGFEVEVPIEHAEPLAYRRRAKLAFDRGRAGYRAGADAAKGGVVDAPTCLVLHPALQEGYMAFRAELLPALVGKGALSLSRRDAGAVVVVTADQEQDAEAYAAAARLSETAGVEGVALRVGDLAPARWGVPEERTPGVDGAPLVGTLGGFSQAHDSLNERLALAVADAAAGAENALELYAGHGNLTVAIAPRVRSLVAVEQDREAAEAMRQNVGARAVDVRVVCEDAVSYPEGRYDTVILDPPRGGAREPLERLGRGPRRIVYVSCHPATLGRDIGDLATRGFSVTSARGFDLFPQTPHVEALVVLDRD